MATTNTRIVIRRDESSNWTTINPQLLAGEQGFETDTGKYKIGTGATWNATPYMVAGATGMITLDPMVGDVGLEESAVKGLLGASAPIMYDADTGMITGDVYSKAETDMGIGMGATGAFVAAEAAQEAADDAQAEIDAMQTGATGIFVYEGDLYTNAEVDAAIGLGATGAFVAAELAQEGVDGLIASGATGALAAAEAAQAGVDDILSGATGGGFVGTFEGPLTGDVTGSLDGSVRAGATGPVMVNTDTYALLGRLTSADGTVVVNPGSDGTDATFAGGTFSGLHTGVGEFTTVSAQDTMTANNGYFGDSTGDHVGRVISSNRMGVVVDHGTDGSDAVFTGRLVGNADTADLAAVATFAEGATGALGTRITGIETDATNLADKFTNLSDLTLDADVSTGATGFDAASITELQTAVEQLQDQVISLMGELKAN